MNVMPFSWFILALAAMISFGGLTLIIKRLTYTLPSSLILFFIFSLTASFYLLFNMRKGVQLYPGSLKQVGLLVLCAVLSFVGNFAAVEAQRLAPNPGYALAVSSGQVVLVTFASVVLFADLKFSIQGACGSLLVFIGLVVLALQKG